MTCKSRSNHSLLLTKENDKKENISLLNILLFLLITELILKKKLLLSYHLINTIKINPNYPFLGSLWSYKMISISRITIFLPNWAFLCSNTINILLDNLQCDSLVPPTCSVFICTAKDLNPGTPIVEYHLSFSYLNISCGNFIY